MIKLRQRSNTPVKPQSSLQVPHRRSAHKKAIRSFTINPRKEDPKTAELREVSYHLGLLHKTYNTNKEKERLALEKLNARVLLSGSQPLPVTEFKRSKNLDVQLREVLIAQKKAAFDFKVNLHVLERMRKTKIHLEHKANLMRRAIQASIVQFDREERAYLRSKDRFSLVKTACREYKESRDSKLKETEQLVEHIEKDYKKHLEVLTGREHRTSRQTHILEKAANEALEKKAKSLQELLRLNKLWSAFLNTKLAQTMKNSGPLEEAFTSIRLYSGITDIEQVVEKFLTREEAYINLQRAIKSTQVKCEEFRDKIKQVEEDVYKVSVADKEKLDLSYIKKDIFKLIKQIGNAQNKKQQLRDVLKRIANWAYKMNKKFHIKSGQVSLIDLIRALIVRVRQMITQVSRDSIYRVNRQRRSDTLQEVFSSPKRREYGSDTDEIDIRDLRATDDYRDLYFRMSL